MKFYCVLEKEDYKSKIRCERLERACKSRKIDFIKILPNSFNYLDDSYNKKNLLYRATRGEGAIKIERFLLNKGLTSLYRNISYGFTELLPSLLQGKNLINFPLIKSVPDFISNENLLNEYIDYVGGFPLVVKVQGGTLGVGVIKIDSFESLNSFKDYIKQNNIDSNLLEFVKHKKQGRLIVLGNEVIATYVNYCTFDFRSNVGDSSEIKSSKYVFSEEIKDLAIRSVKEMGVEFGGVDILFEEETENPYIAEVNMPCGFPKAEDIIGVDIAGKLVDYLVDKSNNINE